MRRLRCPRLRPQACPIAPRALLERRRGLALTSSWVGAGAWGEAGEVGRAGGTAGGPAMKNSKVENEGGCGLCGYMAFEGSVGRCSRPPARRRTGRVGAQYVRRGQTRPIPFIEPIHAVGSGASWAMCPPNRPTGVAPAHARVFGALPGSFCSQGHPGADSGACKAPGGPGGAQGRCQAGGWGGLKQARLQVPRTRDAHMGGMCGQIGAAWARCSDGRRCT